MQALDELQQRCTELGWKHISDRLDTLLEEASTNSITYADFLGSLLYVEENQKKKLRGIEESKRPGFLLSKPYLSLISWLNPV